MPTFVDLQVNGYAGVDFNHDGLTPAALHHACAALQADDVDVCLVAIISDEPDRMRGRLARLATLRAADPLAQRVIAGVHIEGPFINSADGFRGAHPAAALRDADRDVMQRLLDSADGLVKLVTLAPERDPDHLVTKLLVSQGIVVAAGHSDASVDELRAAIEAGVTMFTHLGNGCPMQLHRHDNIIQRVLSLGDPLWLTFIADGHHVPFIALGNYLRLAGIDRCIVVSDAIAPAGSGPGRYTLGEREVVVGEDMVPRATDRTHFVGSAVTMQQSARNLRDHLGLGDADVRALTCSNARRAVRL